MVIYFWFKFFRTCKSKKNNFNESRKHEIAIKHEKRLVHKMKMVKLLKRISQSNQIWVFIFENLRLAKYPRNWERIIMSDWNVFFSKMRSACMLNQHCWLLPNKKLLEIEFWFTMIKNFATICNMGSHHWWEYFHNLNTSTKFKKPQNTLSG